MMLVGLSGSPTPRSKTLIAVERAIEAARDEYPDLDTEVLNIRDYDVQFCDGRDPSLYVGDTRKIIDTVVAADALIVGTPMYRGSYTGVLKNVFDVLPNDAMRGKAVGLIATGGSDHHFLAIEHELRPVMGFFLAHTVPGSVYAKNEDYSDTDLVSEAIVERLRDLAVAVVALAQALPRDLIGAAPPGIERRFLGQPQAQ
jgi:FMN reductase